jgi:hypothetical protein
MHSARFRTWTDMIDLTFLAALTLLVIAGFVTVYAVI